MCWGEKCFSFFSSQPPTIAASPIPNLPLFVSGRSSGGSQFNIEKSQSKIISQINSDGFKLGVKVTVIISDG